MTNPVLDESLVGEFAERALGVLVGAATAQMVYLGDRLGLYRELAASGPATPAELAARSGCAERYIAEWLAQQASVGFISHDAAVDRFELPAEHAVVLADDDSPAALCGVFESLTGWHLGVDRLVELFGSGGGVGWTEHDPRVHRGAARFFGVAYRVHLVGEWIPALGFESVLRQGGQIADVGCGHGISTVIMAEAFPHSRFIGVDPDAVAIERAKERADAAGVSDRVRFEVADAANLDGGPYDLVWFFDCLHDFGDPVAAASRAHEQLAEQGAVALVEPFAHEDLAENLTANPGAGLHYAASTFLCVPHSLSEPGHTALGAQAGGHRIADVLRAAGLTRTERVATTPLHAVYGARP